MLKSIVAVGLSLVLGLPVWAEGAKLKVGDPAPKLQAGKFVQGDAVKGFEKGKVYVVEFWATWCGPCRATIPHLNELAQQFEGKGLVVIGQNVWERNDADVGPFIKKMGEKMKYRVALDDKSANKDGAMAAAWMDAAGQDGIPVAFVVDQAGTVVWIGHPMDGLNEIVPDVLAGKFDWKKEQEKRVAAEKAAERAEAAHAAPVATLKVGDAAPKMQTGKFVQGEPVKAFEKGKIYVVEFWATWCPPCRESIPHLNELAKKFADQGVIVIGQNVSEQNDAAVEKFVKKMGEKMQYRVALDDKSKDEEGAMNQTWMDAAGASGIPTAFVVDKEGRLAWIGHPMQGLDKVLAGLVAGTYDAKKEAEKQAKMEKEMKGVMEDFMTAMEDENWDQAIKALGEMEKVVPEEMAGQLWMAHLQILMQKKDYDAAGKLLKTTAKKFNDDDEQLNNIAWTAITTKKIKPDLDFAEKTSKRSNELSKHENSAHLDTLARVYFMKGDKAKAIELQKKAISFSSGELKQDLKDTLDDYENDRLPEVEDALGEDE